MTTTEQHSLSVTNATADTPAAADATADAVAERLFASTLGALEMYTVYIGDRLGWYQSLRADGPATPTELATRTATHPRYAREWLEQQAVYGLLSAEDGDERRYTLPPGAAEVLTDDDSLSYLGPLGRMLAAVGAQMPELLDAYRNGGGVSWDELGPDAREGQAAVNRPLFLHSLPDTLRTSELDPVLRSPGARILDVGCGAGWSSIALARAYPDAEIVGVDVDAPSIELARHNAASAGAPRGLTFRTTDAGTLHGEDGSYDAAFAFECVHDMARPVEVLTAVRRALRPDGVAVVVDEAVADEFTAPGDDIERFMYGWSVLVCLPDGMSSAPSEGTGTVMRHSTLRSYAQRAGFSTADVLPIEGFGFFRFYSLH